MSRTPATAQTATTAPITITSVELKRLQIVTRLSQETICFVADVYVNGKNVGFAENKGHGGNTNVQVDRALLPALAEYAMTVLPAEFKDHKHLNAVEWLIDDIVGKKMDAKEAARVAKKTAKIDAGYKTTCPARGTHAARFDVADAGGVATRWVEFRVEADARAAAEKKYPKMTNWTVVA